jgi:hypothetical protein
MQPLERDGGCESAAQKHCSRAAKEGPDPWSYARRLASLRRPHCGLAAGAPQLMTPLGWLLLYHGGTGHIILTGE